MNGSWNIQMKNRDPSIPRIHNPIDAKSAILYVARNNVLTMLYQQESGRWYAVHRDLDQTGLTEELISHASFCEYGNQLLLVTHDESKRFRMLAISIEWNASQQARPNGQPSIRVNPSLNVMHIAGIDHVTAEHANVTQLTGLTLLPASQDPSVDQQLPSLPTIVATFTHAALPSSTTQHLAECFTAISRWQLETVSPKMHESYGNLKQNANATPALPSKQCLQRLPDQITMKLVLSLKPTSFGTLLAFIMSDGSVEFRDRNTFSIIEPSMDTTTASSLPQSGFEHTSGFHCIDATVSHDAAAMAYVQPDGTMKGKVMEFRHGWHHPDNDGIIDGKGLVEAAVMCIARQHMCLTWYSAATAETLSLLPRDLSPASYELFFQQLARFPPKTYDTFSMDENKRQMHVLRDPHLPRALSAQLVLGTRPPSQSPTLPAQLAWAILNLKHVTVSLMTTIGRAEATPGLGADVVHSLHGAVRWSVDVYISILEALLTVERKTSQGVPAAEAVQAYITETKSPAFHLLLCSYSRTFLRYLAIYLTRYFKLQGQKIGSSRALQEKAQMLELARLGETLPYKLSAILDLVMDTEKGIMEAYTQTNTSERSRGEIELSMITECAVPTQIHGALNNLMATTLPKLTPELDIGKLYFWDTTWLQLTPRGGEGPRYDALKKTPLRDGVRLRRCRRCNSAMEDVAATTEANRDLPPWLQAAQRQCVCTCAWYLP
jgi:mediator of RNA polymerase II transcription subunit 16